MEQEYWTKCDVCDIETEVLVVDAEQDIPVYCPMCGSDIQYEELE